MSAEDSNGQYYDSKRFGGHGDALVWLAMNSPVALGRRLTNRDATPSPPARLWSRDSRHAFRSECGC